MIQYMSVAVMNADWNDFHPADETRLASTITYKKDLAFDVYHCEEYGWLNVDVKQPLTEAIVRKVLADINGCKPETIVLQEGLPLVAIDGEY